MKKIVGLALAFVLLLTACGANTPPDGGNGPPDASQQEQDNSMKDTPAPKGGDAEFTIVIDGTDSWTPFEGASGVTFANERSDIISTSDDGKTVTFTGLSVGEAVITASDGKDTASALVKVVKRSEEVGYYLTYKEPVSHYSYEIDGGPDNGGSRRTFDGEIRWEYFYQDGILMGNWMTMDGAYSFTENGEQIAGTEYKDSEGIFELNINYWPCSNFAEIISGRPLYDLYANEPERLPDHLDVSEYYVKSEQVCGVDCYVLNVKAITGDDMIYWVDSETGWTLQYGEQNQSTDEIEIWWTVTSFEIGAPQ